MRIKLLLLHFILLTAGLYIPSAQAVAYQQSQADTLKSNSVTIKGKIINAENGEPVPFANVFLNNTMIGTTTDEQGLYTLPGTPFGNVELMVSYVGFFPFKRPLRIESSQTLTINISLKPNEQVLSEVQVQAKQDKTWQRQYKKFEKYLLGQTINAPLCTILNPWVMDFKEDENTLIATASQPLEIENKALGYKLLYYLKQFELSKSGALYLGETRFEALTPGNAKEEKRWLTNRQEAYNGSVRHFFRSLVTNTWEEEGFLAYKVDREQIEGVQTMHNFLSQQIGQTLSKLVPAKILFPGPMNFERRMVFPGKIEFHYTRSTDRYSPYKDAPYQVSRIKIRKSYIEININGHAYDPSSYELTGYLVKEGVADMLPYDYLPEGAKNILSQAPGSVAASSFLDTLKARMERTNTLQAQQKVYLHLDKPFYASGEVLWYSAYLVEASQNSLFSGSQVLYVDLISPEGKLIKQQKLKVMEGRASGDILLPKSLSTGVYRIRSYTNWMRNTDPAYFFDRPLEVYQINQKTAPTPMAASGASNKSFSVQFFPEGGNLVRDIASRVGFKAIGSDGKAIAVKGMVLDENGNKVISFESNALGMGSFDFKPVAGKKYTAACESNTGKMTAALPTILSQGFTMSASRPDTNTIQVKVVATDKFSQAQIYLVGAARGVIYHSDEEKLNNGVAILELPAAKFPEGVCQLTLFNSQGEPQCERLIFVHHPDAQLSIRVKPDKSVYQPRDKAELDITITDAFGTPASATFSLSVLDASQIPEDTTQTHILSYLLLTSDLKGHIEYPAYYFSGNRVGRPEDLDLLMLTQGWRRFSWQQVISAQAPSAPYNMESGLLISGRAVTQSGKKTNPLIQQKITFTPLDSLNPLPQEITTSHNGRFRLATYDFIDSTRVMYQALDKKEKRINVILQLDSFPQPEISKPLYPYKSLQPESSTLSYLDKARLRSKIDSTYAMFGDKVLSEVVVQGKKVKVANTDLQGENRIYSEADAILVIDEKFPPTSNIYDMMAGRLAGVQVVRDADDQNSYNVKIRSSSSFNSSTQPLYLIDGMPIEDPDGNALMSFNPLDVARIEILKGASASMYGVRGGNGVIAIYTKKGKSAVQNPSTAGLKSIGVAGFKYPREFYSPTYDVEKDENIKPDHRATLYWGPLLYTDETGKAKISFFNSDEATNMQVVIEGISISGQPFIQRLPIGEKKKR